MRDLHQLDEFRITDPKRLVFTNGHAGDGTCGAFELASEEDGNILRVIASSGGDWDHVSVSREDRCPTWAEMEFVKRKFFLARETAVQFHVPTDQHINFHQFCLHLWRPQKLPVHLPPGHMV